MEFAIFTLASPYPTFNGMKQRNYHLITGYAPHCFLDLNHNSRPYTHQTGWVTMYLSVPATCRNAP